MAIAKHVAADLVQESQEDEAQRAGQLAIAFLRKLLHGKQPSRGELAELAEALDVDSQKLDRLKPLENGEKKPNGI